MPGARSSLPKTAILDKPFLITRRAGRSPAAGASATREPSMTQQRGPWRAGRSPVAEAKPGRTPLAALLAAGAVVVLVVVLLIRFPGALAVREDRVSLVYGLILLVGVGASFLVRQRVRPGTVLRHALLWAGLALLLVLGYGARHDLARLGGRVVGELVPFAPV